MTRTSSTTRRAFIAALPAAVSAGAQPAGFRATEVEGERIIVAHGGAPLFEYRYGKSLPKPYVHPLYARDGVLLSLDSPPDHKHHRALMIGWTEVNGYDFWGEPKSTPGPHGLIRHSKFERLGKNSGELTALNEWVADEQIVLLERRTLRARFPGPGTTALDWESELRAVRGDVTLKAHKNGFDGLGIRFVRSMDGGGALNSEGADSIEKANGLPALWCAYIGETEKGRAGVAIFDHPSNPRHPNPFFVMKSHFGYLSAAPTFHSPLPVAAGRSLRLRYRVLTFTGEPVKAKLDALYASWIKGGA